MRKRGGGEDRCIILENKRLKGAPDYLVGLRDINMTAPYPLFANFLLPAHQCHRLGVVDKDNIAIELHLLDILLGDFMKKSEVSVRNILLPAVQCIVEFLGHLEKLWISFNDIPTGIYTKLLQ